MADKKTTSDPPPPHHPSTAQRDQQIRAAFAWYAAQEHEQQTAAMHAILASRRNFVAHLTAVEPAKLKELPTLVIQAVVQRGAQTQDGHIIEAVLQPWFDIVAALQRDPNSIFQVPWEKVEELIAGAYHRMGAEVILTPRSGDHGRDVIAVLPAMGSVRVVESVKAYGRGHLVKAKEVRELYGVVQKDKASKGFLTTTSDFAPRIWKDATLTELIGPRLELINGTQLLKRLAELASKTPTK